jgi:quercetin dioxygenase-like cupin family protein
MAVGAAAQKPHIVPLGPMRGDVEILAGHPDSVGRPFVMRIHELPGTIVPPHSHPVDEHITVLAGTWYFGIGEHFDSAALTAMPAGTYAYAPKGTTMFGASPEDAVVQVHGIGPFHIHWRDGLRMLSDSGAAPTFRFHVNDAVTGSRGAGRVRQGYASGALVQYEVVRPDSQVYMAREGDLRRP